MMWRVIVSTIIDASNTIVPEALTLLFQSTVIGAVGIAAYTLARRRGPVVQSVVLRLCLTALVALPVVRVVTVSTRVNIILPRAGLPGRTPDAQTNIASSVAVPVTPSDNTPISPDNRPAAILSTVSPVSKETVKQSPSMSGRNPAERQNMLERGGGPHLVTTVRSAPMPGLDSMSRPAKVRESGRGITGIIAAGVYSVVALVWIVLSIFFVVRWGVAMVYLVNLRRTSIPARRKYDQRCRHIAAEMGVSPPYVLVSQKVQSVFLVGTVRPAIVLPGGRRADHMGSREIFIHELTHLKRHDNLWKALVQLVIVLYPLQPFVWIINRYLDVTSDFICDDMVVRASGTGGRYAAQLHDIAVTMATGGDPALLSGAGILSMRSPFLMRIERILESTSSRRVSARMHEICWNMTLFVCALVFTGFVGFQSEVERINSTVSSALKQPANLQTAIGNALGKVSVAAAFPERYTRSDGIETEVVDNARPEPLAKHTHEQEAAPAGTTDILAADTIKVDGVQVAGLSAGTMIAGNAAPTVHRIETSASGEPERFEDVPGIEEMLRPVFDSAAAEPDALPAGDRHGLTDTAASAAMLPTVEMPVQTLNPGMGIATIRGISRIHIPTGTQLNVEVSDCDLTELDLNDPEEKKLYDVYRSLEMNQNEPAWSPDGSKIAFTDNSRIWMVAADGGEPQMVYENFDETTGLSVGGIKSLCFSADGTELTFQKNVYDETRGSIIKRYSDTMVVFSKPVLNVETVNVETGEHRILFGEAEGCVWSPGGRYCFFLTWNQLPDDVEGIWPVHGCPMLYDVELDEFREIDTGDDNTTCGQAAFSPDESALILPVRQGAGPVNLISIDIESGNRHWLSDRGGEAYTFQYIDFPQYSPDGAWLLYTDFSLSPDNVNKRLMLLNIDSGATFRLLEEEGTSTAYGKWSPDGARIAYLSEQYDASYIYLYTFYPANYVLEKPASSDSDEAPRPFGLTGNYPNPFNPSTTILFNLPDEGTVDIDIYNTGGQKVRQLVSEYREAGEHAIVWDGTDDYGLKVSSGIYLARMSMNGHISSHKMTLQK